MKQDVVDALSGRFPRRIASKETLNHPGIINHASGLDVFQDTSQAFEIAWNALGIDIHPPAPTESAPPPKAPGGTWEEGNTRYADLGVHPTSMPLEHCPELDKSDPDWIYQYQVVLDREALEREAAALRRASLDFRSRFGERAVFYHLYYTTLFMWPIVTFGWEPFLLAAASDPERFDRHFWQPWTEVSRLKCQALAALDDEVVFTHDDLTVSTGPVFAPAFFEKYIFPRYEYIWEPITRAGKKLVFVCDGNLDVFLERLLEFPIAGIMFENPTTPLDRVLATRGQAGRGFIGGVSTPLLTQGTPDEVRAHTRQIIERCREYPGFILSACGGLHGNIPMANMLAYFELRNDMGIDAQV